MLFELFVFLFRTHCILNDAFYSIVQAELQYIFKSFPLDWALESDLRGEKLNKFVFGK